jgi:hypothetical protein
VPEALGLGLLPWLLLAGWHTLAGAGRRWAAALTGLTAALMLLHNISALLGLGLLVGWLAAFPLVEARPSRMAVARSAGAIALGMGLAAFFWLPAIGETGIVQLGLAQGGLYDPLNWLYDPIGGGPRVGRKEYPHTRPGPADLALIFDYNAVGGFMPEKVSLGQLLIWLGAVSGALAALAWWRRPGGRAARLALLWAAFAAVCWFFNTSWSGWVWRQAPLLPLVQFPWRFYGPFALCLAMAGAASLAALPGRGRSGRLVAAGVAGLVLLLAVGALAARPYRIGPLPTHDVDERNLAGLEYNRYGAGTTSGGEFLPRTAGWGEDGNRRGIKIYDDLYPQASWQAGLVKVLEGQGAATAVFHRPGWIAARVEAATPLRLAVHQLLFPGWRAYLDGRPVALETTPYVESIGGSLGIMVLEVPAGEHNVEVRFGPTPARSAGAAVSAAALLLAAAWFARPALWPPLRRRLAARPDTRGPLRAAERRLARPGAPAAALALAALLAAGAAAGGGVWDARPRLGAAAPGPLAYGRVPLGGGLAGATRVVVDVAGAVAQGRAETAAPGIAGQGALQPFLDVRYQDVGGETRRWLYMHPPASAGVRLRVPPRAYFQAGLALDPRTWGPGVEVGDGVRFVLEAEQASGRRILLTRDVNPRAVVADRRWIDVWVDLGDLAGQEVRLILRTEPASEPNFDWAGWANPQIVTWTGARPHPGVPPVWAAG